MGIFFVIKYFLSLECGRKIKPALVTKYKNVVTRVTVAKHRFFLCMWVVKRGTMKNFVLTAKQGHSLKTTDYINDFSVPKI